MQMLVVSIHDVSPRTQQVVEAMLQDLKLQGVKRCSLLVIPNHHGLGWLEAFPEFVKWLHQKFQEGHEIVLHGLYHLRPQRQRESLLERWITKCYTAGEGEFFDLSYEEAFQKLSQGRTELEKIGVSKEACVGFIAPAWLLSKAAEKAVRDLGFWYTTRLGGVVKMSREAPVYYSSQSMVYSTRTRWRRVVSLCWNELLFQVLTQKQASLLRMGLHPPDWEHAQVRCHALSSIRRALSNRMATTYREWLQEKDKE